MKDDYYVVFIMSDGREINFMGGINNTVRAIRQTITTNKNTKIIVQNNKPIRRIRKKVNIVTKK